MWPTDNDPKLPDYDLLELPGQQLVAANAQTPLDHILNLDIKADPGILRMTGIAATVGQSTMDINVLERLMANGMNIAIINTNFGNKDDHIALIKMLRSAAKNYGARMGRSYPLAIAFRLSGRKIKTGRISQMYGDSVELKAGDELRLTTDETYKERCSMFTVYIDFQSFAEQMKKNDVVVLDNDLIALKVESVSKTIVVCRIERGGDLGSYKDVFVPNKVFKMPSINQKDKEDIEAGVQHQVDMFIATFVTSSNVVTDLRNMIGEKGKRISIISNICTLEGLRMYDNILAVSDGIMITRQELGTDISSKKLILAQKNLIARANKANIPVFICAHIFSSMRYSQLALRSEHLDLANMVLDGVDVVVLSAETSVGLYPVESIAALHQACKEAESCMWSKQIFNDFINNTPIPCDQTTGTAMAAVLVAFRSLAAAIVVITSTGKSAHVVSQFKPRCPIMAVTRYAPKAKMMQMWRDTPHADFKTDIDKRVSFATKWGVEQGFIRVGDPVVVVCGWRQGSGSTNTMYMKYVENETI